MAGVLPGGPDQQAQLMHRLLERHLREQLAARFEPIAREVVQQVVDELAASLQPRLQASLGGYGQRLMVEVGLTVGPKPDASAE